MQTAEQLLTQQQRRMNGVRNTLQGCRKYKMTKTLPKKYIVLNLTTTGPRPGADRIIQIGAIKYSNNKQVARFQTLINPRRYVPIEVTKQTKITNFLVETAPVIEEEIAHFLTFIEDLPIVTYEASFHMKFLYALEQVKGIELPPFTVVDVTRLARKVLTTISKDNLEKLTTYLQAADEPEDIMNTCVTVHGIYQLCVAEFV